MPVLAYALLCFGGIVVKPVSIGHITSLCSPQNGQVTPCATCFITLYGPETLNVFLHVVQVMIFSITASLHSSPSRRIADGQYQATQTSSAC
jgi:hypothetical protein